MGQSKERSGIGCGTLAGWGALLSGLAAVAALVVHQGGEMSPDASSSSPEVRSSPSTQHAAALISRARQLKVEINNIENSIGKLEAVEVKINQDLLELSPENPFVDEAEANLEKLRATKREQEDLLSVAKREQQEVNDALRQMGINPP